MNEDTKRLVEATKKAKLLTGIMLTSPFWTDAIEGGRDAIQDADDKLAQALASLDRTAPEPAEHCEMCGAGRGLGFRCPRCAETNAPAQEVAGLVEKVARIIDADAFRSVDEHLELARSQSRRFSLSGAGNGEIALANLRGLEPRRNAALKTAKRILTALSSSPSQGGETL